LSKAQELLELFKSNLFKEQNKIGCVMICSLPKSPAVTFRSSEGAMADGQWPPLRGYVEVDVTDNRGLDLCI